MGLEQITRRESLRLIAYVAAISSGVGGVVLTAARYLTPPGLSNGPLTDADFNRARMHESLRNEFCALFTQQLKAEGRLSFSTGLVYDPDYDKLSAYVLSLYEQKLITADTLSIAQKSIEDEKKREHSARENREGGYFATMDIFSPFSIIGRSIKSPIFVRCRLFDGGHANSFGSPNFLVANIDELKSLVYHEEIHTEDIFAGYIIGDDFALTHKEFPEYSELWAHFKKALSESRAYVPQLRAIKRGGNMREHFIDLQRKSAVKYIWSLHTYDNPLYFPDFAHYAAAQLRELKADGVIIRPDAIGGIENKVGFTFLGEE